MFIKFFEDKVKDKYLKGYKFNKPYDVNQIINNIQNTNYEITNVHINEIGDIGEKTFEGSYTLEEFLLIYNQISKDNIESLNIDLTQDCKLFLRDDIYISLSSSENIELDDLFESGRKRNL